MWRRLVGFRPHSVSVDWRGLFNAEFGEGFMSEREETYQVAYYHQDDPGRKELTGMMSLDSANAEASRLAYEGYTTQIINAEDEEPEDAVDL